MPVCNPVYNWHVRLLPEPSLHANPLIQTPPLLHLEGLHPIQWLMSDPKQLSSTVLGDCLRFAFQDHDSGRLIPHLPLPPMAGPFLQDTLGGSKYQILFHQPNVLLDGSPVGVFQWPIAPPWRCIELPLPLPKFLAKAGRAAAARGSHKRMADAQRRIAAGPKAEAAWAKASSLGEAASAMRDSEAAAQGRVEALKQGAEAAEAERYRQEFTSFEERQGHWREVTREALEEKREYDRIRRKSAQLALQHDSEAVAAFDRAQRSEGVARDQALREAESARARAAKVRQGARAWAQEAGERETSAHDSRREAKEERAAWRAAEEKRAKALGKKVNPVQQATGKSNAGLTAPSFVTHLPFPCTVEIQVSSSQIGNTWKAGLIAAAADALKYYAGFLVDGILAPGRGKIAAFVLDLLKSGINDTLIDGGAKYLLDGSWPLKISKKLGPVNISASCEHDAKTGTRKWVASVEHKSEVAWALGPARASVEGHGGSAEKLQWKAAGQSFEHTLSKPPADYAHGVPTVN